jgi:hypothetical protein
MPIESFCKIILGINDKCENSYLGTRGSHNGIPEQRSAQPPPMEVNVNGKSSQFGNGY